MNAFKNWKETKEKIKDLEDVLVIYAADAEREIAAAYAELKGHSPIVDKIKTPELLKLKSKIEAKTNQPPLDAPRKSLKERKADLEEAQFLKSQSGDL